MGPKITVEAGAYIALSGYLLLMPFPWVAGLVLAAAVHELGHCAAVWATGGRIFRIRIGPSGAKIETDAMAPKQTLICALAGPAAGALVCLYHRWFPQAAVIALVQTMFNLLPVLPFDGGRAVMAGAQLLRDKAVAKSSRSVYNKFD